MIPPTIRSLSRSPGFVAAVGLTLALGIGANTAIFSVVDGVLLRPAPFTDMDRLTMVWETDRKSGTLREPASIPDYFDFQERATRYAGLAAFSPIPATIAPVDGEPHRVAALWASHQLLPLLGIRPLIGSGFTAEQDQPGEPPVALISEALWGEQFNRRAEVIGSTIRINDTPHRIVGVLPRTADFGILQVLRQAAYRRGFADRGGRVRVDLWLPLRPDRSADRGNHPIFVVGRLASGATLSMARQEMDLIAADLERLYPQANDGRGVHVEPLAQVVFGGSRAALLVLLGAVGLVLLVACANVANLMLARSTARAREASVRAALGAGTGRLVRQFLLESTILTGLGTFLGVVLALAAVELLLPLAPASIPRAEAVTIDLRVLAVTLGLSVVTAVIFGLIPAFQASRRGFSGISSGNPARASSGREHGRVRSAIVIAELALAVVLMVGAGLLIKSFWRLYQVDAGFEAQGVLKAEFQLPAGRYSQRMSEWPRWTEIHRFAQATRERLAAVPGVRAAAIVGVHPLEAGYTSSIVVPGREAEAADWPEPYFRMVDPGYWDVSRTRLLEGRFLESGDDLEASPVVALNASARLRFFESRAAIGQVIRFWGRQWQVVGVVADERFHGLDTPASPALYLSTGQAPVPNGSILVRVDRDPAAFAPVLRRVMREIEPALGLYGVEPLETTLSQSTADRRFVVLLLGGFAGMALLLAVIGVYGVLSYAVAQRTRELGIRMALGADQAGIGRLVLAQGAKLAGLGVGLGLLGALGLVGALRSMLYGVSPTDPATMVAVALLLGALGLIATWMPARRATRVDPMVALRQE